MPTCRPSALAALALLALAGGCMLLPRPDATRYYTLVAVSPTPGAASSALRVGLGPVTLPGYLGRLSLATRVDSSQIRYADLDRWAEPLQAQFARTLGEALGRALGTVQITRFPWYPTVPLDVAVQVTVLAFETDTAGTARLDAAWTVRDPKTATVGHEGYSTITEPAAGEGTDAGVAALSRAVDQLAQQIAASLPRR